MPIIRPISDLRNRAHEISELCHQEIQPVFITKNGEGELVVMSQEYFEQMQARLELYEKLSVAESEESGGKRPATHRQVITTLRRRLRARTR
jgi:prevent-host-death family protein